MTNFVVAARVSNIALRASVARKLETAVARQNFEALSNTFWIALALPL